MVCAKPSGATLALLTNLFRTYLSPPTGWYGIFSVRCSVPPIFAIHSTKPLGWKGRQSSMNIDRLPSGSFARMSIALMYCQVQSTTG